MVLGNFLQPYLDVNIVAGGAGDQHDEALLHHGGHGVALGPALPHVLAAGDLHLGTRLIPRVLGILQS